jgi:hypothetical protein
VIRPTKKWLFAIRRDRWIMKRIATISAAVVLGTLLFNVALVQAGDKGHKGSSNSSNSSSKQHSGSDHCQDFWKDLCYDFQHDFCHHGSDHCNSGSTEYMGGSKNAPPGTPGGGPLPTRKFYPLHNTQLLGQLNAGKQISPVLAKYGQGNFRQLLPTSNQSIPNIGTGLGGFTGAVGSGLNAVGNAAGSVLSGVGNAAGSVVNGVAGAVGDIGSGVAGAIGDLL